MDLKTFLTQAKSVRWPSLLRRAYIDVPGFTAMYVRYTQRCVEGRLLDPVFEIANVEVATSQRGKGIFSRFLEEVISLCPDTAIYVECVHNERLATMLQKRGFQNVRGSDFLLRDPSEYRKENV